MFKKTLFLLVLFTFMTLGGIASAELKLPTKPQGMLNDYAGVIPASARASLEQKLRDYEKQTSNEIGIAILPSLQGYEIKDYSVALFKKWGVGKKGKNNGVLIFMAIKEQKVRIEVGYGLEPIVTDFVAKSIVEKQLKPKMAAGDYAGAITSGVDSLIKTIGSKGQASVTKVAPEEGFPTILIVLIVIVAILLLLFILSKVKGYGSGGGYYGGSSGGDFGGFGGFGGGGDGGFGGFGGGDGGGGGGD